MVVTETSFEPTLPAGVTAVREFVDVTTILVAAIPPTKTLLTPVKFVPVIVIAVPAVSGPAIGLTDVIVGAAIYVNAFGIVVVPPTVVSATSFAPATEFAGAIVVTELALTTTMFVVATPPMVMMLAPVKLLPLIVIKVPAVKGPEPGETEVIVGGATNALALVAVAPMVNARAKIIPSKFFEFVKMAFIFFLSSMIPKDCPKVPLQAGRI